MKLSLVDTHEVRWDTWSPVVDETFDVHIATVRKGLVHLENSSEGFDASGHNMPCCICSMLVVLPLGVGRQALHPPCPSTISSTAMWKSEEEGFHFRPSSSHCGML